MIKIIPKIYEARVFEAKMENSRDLLVTFKLLNPNRIEFVPGQFINLRVSANTYRSYSICSLPRFSDQVSIVVTVNFDGIGANYLKGLKTGDVVSFIGPSGRFRLFENSLKNAYFVCTGTGISPYIPMLSQLLNLDNNCKVKLYFGCRNENELLFETYLNKLTKTYANFNYELCVSQPNSFWRGNVGYVTKFMKISNPKTTQVYICGLSKMIDSVLELCKSLNISQENISFEKY